MCDGCGLWATEATVYPRASTAEMLSDVAANLGGVVGSVVPDALIDTIREQRPTFVVLDRSG